MYEISEGSILSRQSILEEGNEVKENISNGVPLGSCTLGTIEQKKYGATKLKL